MAMKRRGFLTMLGAAIGTPLLPAVPAMGMGRSAFEAAIAHAQKYPVISVGGLAKRGGLSMAQAEAMIKRLALEGKVKLVGPSKYGAVRATSRILINDPWGLGRTAQERCAQAQQSAKTRQSAKARQTVPSQAKQPFETDLTTMMMHLRQLASDYGMTLRPQGIALQ